MDTQEKINESRVEWLMELIRNRDPKAEMHKNIFGVDYAEAFGRVRKEKIKNLDNETE